MATETPTLRTLGVAVPVTVLMEAAGVLIAGDHQIPPVMILTGVRLAQILVLLAIVGAQGKGPAPVGLARSRILPGIIQGMKWSLVMGAAAAAAAMVLWMIDIPALPLIHTALPVNHWERGLFLLTGIVLGPVAEEIFFRGLIFGYLQRAGTPIALAGSTLVFVLCHQSSGSALVIQTTGGVVFALAYARGGRLTAPVTIHVLGNAALFLLSGVPTA